VILLLLFLSVVFAQTDAKLKCECKTSSKEDGEPKVSFRWKNVRVPNAVIGVWQLTDSQATQARTSNWPFSFSGEVAKEPIDEVDGKLDSYVSSDVTYVDGTRTYCILKEPAWPRASQVDLMNCPLPTKRPSPKVSPFATIAVVGGLFILVLILVLLRQRLQRLKEQERNLNNLQTLRTLQQTNGVDLQGMATHQVHEVPMENNVQMFPVHPMMQSYQPLPQQDPLGTLAPVYTSTYVQPGIQ